LTLLRTCRYSDVAKSISEAFSKYHHLSITGSTANYRYARQMRCAHCMRYLA